MNPVYLGLFFLVLAIVMPMIGEMLKKIRSGSEKYQQILKDFEEQVRSELTECETIEAICGYAPCAAVTNKRLLIGTKTGIETVRFSEISSLCGMDAKGSDTADPDQMMVFTIQAKKKYVLGNHSDGFAQVVLRLYDHMR